MKRDSLLSQNQHTYTVKLIAKKSALYDLRQWNL